MKPKETKRKIDASKTYVTYKNKFPVRILATGLKRTMSVVAVVTFQDGSEGVCCYDPFGSVVSGSVSGLDLVEAHPLGDMSEGNETEIEERVIAKIRQRRDVGRAKYGKTMERKDLTLTQWLTHLQEELMDASLYVEKAMKEIPFTQKVD